MKRFATELGWATVVAVEAALRLTRTVTCGQPGCDLGAAASGLVLLACVLIPLAARAVRGDGASFAERVRGWLAMIWGPVAALRVGGPMDGGQAVVLAILLGAVVALAGLAWTTAFHLRERRRGGF